MNNIMNMFKKINTIKSKNEFISFLAEIKKTHQYMSTNLIVYTPTSLRDSQPSIYGDISTKIQNFISEDGTFREYCINESTPINYQKLLINNTKKCADVQLYQNTNLLIPINGFGNEYACILLAIPGLTVHPEVLEKIGWYWLMLSPLIYDKCHKLFTPFTEISMTKRELECIKWAAEGKTSWEISKLLSISQRTVDFHLANCITKTDSVNRQQAIVKCVLSGGLLTNNI